MKNYNYYLYLNLLQKKTRISLLCTVFPLATENAVVMTMTSTQLSGRKRMSERLSLLLTLKGHQRVVIF